jgi:molybdopterin converting factor small subunit
MSITIQIPTALRPYAGGDAEVQVEAATVGEALQRLVARHEALKRHLFNEQGRLRSFVNVFLGDEDVRFLDGQATALPAGATLLLVPAIAGGSR